MDQPRNREAEVPLNSELLSAAPAVAVQPPRSERRAWVRHLTHRQARVNPNTSPTVIFLNAIIQDVSARTGGEVRLGAGTLYRSIQRMQEQGLITETRERPEPEMDDERRRYYRITSFGAAVARAEARRLSRLVKLARASGFAPERA